WLTKRGESVAALQTTLTTPVGLTMPPITVSQLEKVFTAPVNSTKFRGLYLTVAFSEVPDRTTHELLSALLTQLEGSIESSTARSALHTTRLRIAERLIEPDFNNLAQLRRHCDQVAEVTEAFTNFLGLAAAEAEMVKVTALVHDAGMRLLDYDRLYRKRELTHDELALLREHVIVGAALVEPLLGNDVARAVLSHHERVDGAGYPHQLRGEDIPLASRIVQICDTYVAISDAETYQTPGTPEGALAAIRRGAGGQFDPELAIRFEEMMRTRTAKLPAR
ncbi:MAG TPA: HD domain-containing phosphohydrolase, partial [Thermoanaerobaculia bacterium]|nr:HD domain-containing phosphohydrolase [Thermoanaerobaculia bacterium]